MSSTSAFNLFSSLRYDPLLLTSDENSQPALNFISPSPFYMLVYHRDRMLEAAQHFEFHEVAKKLVDGEALHIALLAHVQEWISKAEKKDEPLKVRVLFDKAANMSLEISPVPSVPISTLYPPSLNLPKPPSPPHPANTEVFKPSPLTGGALTLGPTDSLPSNSSTETSEVQAPTWTIRLDSSPTPISPFTLLKTTNRSFYDISRSRALPSNPSAPACAEVMLFNECQELTEGTVTSLYLFRGGRWVTPPVGVPAGEFTSGVLKDGEKKGDDMSDEGELRTPFAGRWGHSVRSEKVGSGGQRGTTRRWALAKGMCMEEPVGVDTVTVGEGVWVSNGVRGFGFGKVVE
ncbi:hypothetical protein BCR34DRAFT_545370 [Clohesyomyces aquaticus]|uniref:Aminotransferase class IV-domain-containing protein n=1 Tax=Clohesyomyces aquaticus TaxID=1231657 RepID=A0A1Y1YYN1_9PLEO|nr:hypothetical protein BCR34DRAFT_545370 [Clohesyomyces aquaticus]